MSDAEKMAQMARFARISSSVEAAKKSGDYEVMLTVEDFDDIYKILSSMQRQINELSK